MIKSIERIAVAVLVWYTNFLSFIMISRLGEYYFYAWLALILVVIRMSVETKKEDNKNV